MVELGQLERRHAEFENRHVRVFAISNDDQKTAQATQADFPHLSIVADTDQRLATALQLLEPGKGPNGIDTNAPTTFLVDSTGSVLWVFRPDSFIERLPADTLLAIIDTMLR